MTEALIDHNSQDHQHQPDSIVLSNDTTLLATTDDKGEEREGADVTEAKGAPVKIANSEQDGSTRVEARTAESVETVEPSRESADRQDDGASTERIRDEPTDSTRDMDTDTTLPTSTTGAAGTAIAEPAALDNLASQASSLVRAATPSSRTSTPPLGSSALAKKKFSSVNVNQKFLSKAGSPAPTAGAVKPATLNGRPAASPVPIAATSSRLLSTKLTTVPTSKSSTSPNPPNSSSASSSPWAKPAVPIPPADSTSPAAASATLHQPAPQRARVLGSITTPPVMGAGVGIAAAPKPAWRAVSGEPRKSGLKMSQDFPTAKEVADGKMAAQLAAQAQAAHNQAILQGLNAFTQLDPNSHRWDEEDEEDELIDFGDGSGEHHDGHPSAQPSQAPPPDQPVSKSERFAEDFDRSWPRQDETGRVLFNASSNRLEPSRQQPQPLIQPSRVMSRQSEGAARAPPPHLATGRTSERPLPPHLQSEPQDERRMLPPHMATAPPAQTRSLPGPSAAAPPSRSAWGATRAAERVPPPHTAERRELPSQSASFEQTRSPEKQSAKLPPQPFSQAAESVAPETSRAAAPAPQSASLADGVDPQTAEMHTAAEKARLRRLAEEAEREAAAERARQKARELEERFKPKPAVPTNEPQRPVVPTAPPGMTKPTPQITLATRPRPPQPEVALQQPVAAPKGPRSEGQEQPAAPVRGGEASWRSRMQQPAEPVPVAKPQPPQPQQPPQTQVTAILSPPASQSRSSRPTAESFFEAQIAEQPKPVMSPPHDPSSQPKKEANFDSMLARIQAAMAEARVVPDVSPSEEVKQDESSAPKAAPTILTRQDRAPPERTVEPPKPLPFAAPEYFDVTYPDPPKSPPPAWRTYNIRLPKSHPSRGPIPRPRLKSAEGPRPAAPAGFIMSFIAPSENPTMSRADLLLPQPILRRFQRSEPVVSISPRVLEPVSKKGKKKASSVEVHPRAEDPSPPAMSENLLPVGSTHKSQQLRDQRNRADRWNQAESSTTTPREEPIAVSPRKTKSPVKASAAAKAEREGRFAAEGVSTGASDKDKLALTEKPGVRFMVSSELEGDSLLDEVNKMSLETVDEADDKEQVRNRETVAPGDEPPKTPPLARPASPNTSTWPKVPLSYPASRSPARNASQHDHDAIKSVWDGQQATKPVSEQSAPLYPSLNAPVHAESSSSQPLPGSIKMSFSQSQTFSSPGGSGPALASSNSLGNLHRAPSGQAAYAQYGSPQTVASPDGQAPHMMGLSYSGIQAARGGSGFQQGVWSPTAFGTSMASPGYGYGAQKTAMDHKSAASMGYNGKSEALAYGGYPTGYAQHQQGYPTAGYARGGNGVQANMYGYGYGAPGQQARSAGGRFAQANGGDYSALAQAGQYGMVDATGVQGGGYYGGVAPGMYGAGAYQHAQGQGQPPPQPAQPQGRGMGSRKMW
ncbi:hypothetical protein IAU60_006253 [Kwoniella sp. DSM 27419]